MMDTPHYTIDTTELATVSRNVTPEWEYRPTPCDDCRLRQACVVHEFACEDLLWHVKSGECLERDRRPTHRIWLEVQEING